MKRQRIIAMAALLLPLAASAEPVSFHREVWPILRANCVGCHKPGKAKGGLDLTNHAALLKGGKSSDTLLGGHPEKSELYLQIDGAEPEMPKDAEPLIAAETETIHRWIAEGARDDTPSDPAITHRLDAPPIYRSAPAIASVAWSADPPILAIAAWHEVILRSSDGKQVIGRLVGESPRVESVAFSSDGKLLAVAGGAPSEYGEVQIWNVSERKQIRSIRAGTDCVYGVSWSPDGTKVAVGCADKLVRVFAVADGRELMRCDNHIDWVFATAWSHDGARLVSASRDRAIKLIDVGSGHLIDDIAKPREPLLCVARHPTDDLIAFGSDAGQVRLHKIAPRGGRLAEGDDKEESSVREFERLPGPINSLAFSPDGTLLAATGAAGETRIWKTADGKRVAQIPSGGAPLFTVAFSPDSQQLALAGADGTVAFHEAASGKPLTSIVPVPLEISSH